MILVSAYLLELARSCVHALWRNSQVPDQSEPRKYLQDVVRNVDLPPVKALTLRAGIVVVVVVPPLAQRNQGQEPVITTVVSRWKTTLADQMGEGIYAESSVVQKHCADKEAPHKHLPAVGAECWECILKPYA